MTTQADLLEIAKRHEANPGVKALLSAISEARAHAVMNKGALDHQLKVVGNLLASDSTGNIPIDNSDISTLASGLSVALSKISHDFFTLACVLQVLGEEIDY